MTSKRAVELEALAERVRKAEDRAIIAEAQVVSLSNSNAWFYRKWHRAEADVKQLEATRVCRECGLFLRRQKYAAKKAQR